MGDLFALPWPIRRWSAWRLDADALTIQADGRATAFFPDAGLRGGHFVMMDLDAAGEIRSVKTVG